MLELIILKIINSIQIVQVIIVGDKVHFRQVHYILVVTHLRKSMIT